MTTQSKGVPAKVVPPALPSATVSEAQIRQENAEADIASGYTAPEQTGASDNLSVTPPALPQTKSVEDRILDGQRQVADDREDFMADIARRRREHLAEDQPEDAYGVDNDHESDDNHPQEQETSAAQEVQTTQEEVVPVTNDQPRFFTDAAGQRMVELLVNGQKMVVPEQRVIAAAQKLEAGDERLREANFQRQQLDADRAQFERERAAQQIQQPSSTDADNNLRSQLRDGLDRMYNNGDEQALDGLADLLVQGRQNPISVDQVTDAVTAKINQNAWNNALQNDVAAYEADPAFSDITGNPVLAQRAVAMATQYMQQHPEVRTSGISPRQVMNHCAATIRNEAQQYAQALGLVTPQPQTLQQEPQSRAAVVEQRKTQAGNTVVGGGTQRADTSARPATPDGGRSPSSMDAKVAAFAGLVDSRNNPTVRR